jgi:hypothetical protein
MKRLFFVLTVVLAVVLTNCSKTEDDMNSSSQQIDLKSHDGNFVPLKGYSEGECNLLAVANPLVFKRFTGIGNVTHLGLVETVLDFAYLTFSLNPTDPYHGLVSYFPLGHPFHATGYFIAANGDRLNFELALETEPLPGIPMPYASLYTFANWVPVNYGNPAYPPYMPTTATLWPGTAVITGGTGRFEGATGEMQAWGEQWDIPVPESFPPDGAFYAIPVPAKFMFEGEIDF